MVDNCTPFCDEIEAWVVEYALKHKLYAVIDEVAKLHPHVDPSIFDRLSCMRLGLGALSRLALSSNMKEVKAALKFAQEIYHIWPDCVAVRHRTKVIFGLRIRIIMLAIENDLPKKEVSDLLCECFQSPDSQEERMHASVVEVSKEGVSAFIDDVSSYIGDPTSKGRRKLLETYSIVSPKNESFRKVIEGFVGRFVERLESQVSDRSTKSSSPLKECRLEKVQRICKIINGNTTVEIDGTALLRLLRAVHIQPSGGAIGDNADSLLQLFCTAPDY